MCTFIGNVCCAFQRKEIHNWQMSGCNMKLYLDRRRGRRATESARHDKSKMSLGYSGEKVKYRDS